jgi:aminoglycoside phosphotransferase (APT) family kinase protein
LKTNDWIIKNAADEPGKVRLGEDLEIEPLQQYLGAIDPYLDGPIQVQQFPSGHSNLTYLLTCGDRELILRRPPFGANIQSGHDMAREHRTLSALYPHWGKIPRPVAYCDDAMLIGAPFFIMERMHGVILRQPEQSGVHVDAGIMNAISEALVATLAELHAIDVERTGLRQLGHPEGYVQRQVNGWIRRYLKASTDDLPGMDKAASWMSENIPSSKKVSLIHNDFKYDNLVLQPGDLSEVRAVLDWEMATVGDPLMDLGTTLAYWPQEGDPELVKGLPFGLTLVEGNLTREQVVNRYAEHTGTDVSEILFYYVFGLYKVAAIGQQIYARYKKGHSKDKRFEMLIHAVILLSEMAARAIDRKSIGPLG